MNSLGRQAINWMRGFPKPTKFIFFLTNGERHEGTVKLYHLKGNTLPIGVVLNIVGRFERVSSKRIAMDRIQSQVIQIVASRRGTSLGCWTPDSQVTDSKNCKQVKNLLAGLDQFAPVSFTSSKDSPFSGVYELHSTNGDEVKLLKGRKIIKTSVQEIAAHFLPRGFVLDFSDKEGNTSPGNGEKE